MDGQVVMYDPYDPCGGTVQYQYQEPMYGPQTFRQAGKLGAAQTVAEKLDKMTRSRNALIIALSVFVIAFVATLIAVIIIAFPQEEAAVTTVAPATSVTFTMDSTISTLPFNAVQLAIATSYATTVMKAAHCSRAMAAGKSAGTITACEPSNYLGVNSNAGTKATLTLTVTIVRATATLQFEASRDAIVASSASDPNWTVDKASAKQSA